MKLTEKHMSALKVGLGSYIILPKGEQLNQKYNRLCEELIQNFEQILKNQADAEIFRKLQDENMNIDFGLWANNDKIVENLKEYLYLLHLMLILSIS